MVLGSSALIVDRVDAALKDAYSASFKTVYLVTIAFGCLAILASFFTINVDGVLNEQVARKLRGVSKEAPKPKDGVEEVHDMHSDPKIAA